MTEALEHVGPWTAGDLARLPEDGQRYEIIDGSLLVSPPPSPRHQLVAGRIAVFLREAAPKGIDVVEAAGITLDTGRVLVPDVVVATSAALLADRPALEPGEVSLVVEVVSPSSAAMDQVMKPHLYARAGIPWMWRASFGPGGVEVCVMRLSGASYVEETVASGDLLRVGAPYPVEIPVDRLLVAR